MYLLASFIILILVKLMVDVYGTLMYRYKLAAIPQPPVDNMLVGHLNTLRRAKENNKLMDQYVKWVAEYGHTWVTLVYRDAFIFTSDPVIMKAVCTDLETFSKVNTLPIRYLFGEKVVGTNSILSANSTKWAIKRKSIGPFFAKSNMRNLFDECKLHMEEYQVVQMKNTYGRGSKVCLHEQMSYVINSYLKVLGLSKLAPSDVQQVARENHAILDALPKRDKWVYKFTKERSDMKELVRNRRNALSDVIRAKLEEMMKTSPTELNSTDLIGHLIKANCARPQGESQITIASMNSDAMVEVIDSTVDDMMTVILVMDNMVKQLTSMFMFLNDVPGVQKKMFEELREKPLTDYESLNDLKYTEKCLLESLRMGPALLRGTREQTGKKGESAVKVGPYIVPTYRSNKVKILYSEWVMHYNEQHWDNPKTFDPERWANGITAAPFSYMPFFAGARGCLGKHMAMMMMKLTLSVIAQNFDITQQFDDTKPPVISQSHAVMRIINRVDCFIEPTSVQ